MYDVQKLLNDQLNLELYASHQYLAMAAWAESQNYSGFADWLMENSDEERDHALKIYTFSVDVFTSTNSQLQITDMLAPIGSWNNMIELFETIQMLESKVTLALKSAAQQCLEAQDFSTKELFNDLLIEQVQAESFVAYMLDQIKKSQDCYSAMLMLDEQLSEEAKKSVNVKLNLAG